MAVSAINATAIASISAINGTLKSALSAINGQTLAPPITLVQQAVNTVADGTGGVAADLGTFTAGNTVIACISFLDTQTVDSIILENNGAMTEAITSTVAGVTSTIYYITNAAASDGTVTLTTVGVGGRTSMHISEWANLANAAPEDTSTGTDVGGSTAEVYIVPATQDPTSANNLVIGIGGYVNATDDYSSGPTNSFTRLTATGGASVFQECGYLIRTADHSAVTSSVATLTAPAWAAASASFGGS